MDCEKEKNEMKKIIALAVVASVAVGVVAEDIVSWKGAELSAWTNHVSRFAHPRMTADGIALEAVDRDPQISVSIPVPFAGWRRWIATRRSA